MIEHILIPLDESQLSERALQHARRILKPGGKLSLIYVLDDSNEPFNRFDVVEGQLQRQNFHEHAQAYLEDKAAALRAEDIPVSVEVANGHPAQQILEAAKRQSVDAIVMSTHGRSGFSRWIMGSVTQKVLSAAECPVYIIPPEDRPAP